MCNSDLVALRETWKSIKYVGYDIEEKNLLKNDIVHFSNR